MKRNKIIAIVIAVIVVLGMALSTIFALFEVIDSLSDAWFLNNSSTLPAPSESKLPTCLSNSALNFLETFASKTSFSLTDIISFNLSINSSSISISLNSSWLFNIDNRF